MLGGKDLCLASKPINPQNRLLSFSLKEGAFTEYKLFGKFLILKQISLFFR